MNKLKYLLPLPFLALLALLALAGPATPAHADTLPPVSLTASAHVDVYVAPGQEVAADWFTEDSGADPLAITMSEASWISLARQSPAIGWVQSLSPSQFDLDSGQSEDVNVTVDVPPGTPDGNYYMNVVTWASLPGCSGSCLAAVVAGTLEVHVAG